MSNLDYCVFRNDDLFLKECNGCSGLFRASQNEFIENLQNKIEEEKWFPQTLMNENKDVNRYNVYLVIDNRLYFKSYEKLEVNNIDKNTYNGNFGYSRMKEIYQKCSDLEGRIELNLCSDCIEKGRLVIKGWYIYKDCQYVCDDISYCDFSKNNKYVTPGFPLSLSFPTRFSNEKGDSHYVEIKIISAIFDSLMIKDIIDDVEENRMAESTFYLNSACAGWHKIFGEYRYIFPNSLCSQIKPRSDSEKIENAISALCRSDYSILIFFFSIYAMGKSFLNKSSEYPIGINIKVNDDRSCEILLKQAQHITRTVSLPYMAELNEYRRLNRNISPAQYFEKSLKRKESLNKSGIRVGKFRDIISISNGKYIANTFDKESEFSDCKVSDDFLMKKLKSDQSHIFFNLVNQSQFLINYSPNDSDIEITSDELVGLKEGSELLIYEMTQYMQESMEQSGYWVNSAGLKNQHNKIIFEKNTRSFNKMLYEIESYTRDYFIYDAEEYEKNAYMLKFWNNVRYGDFVELYESKYYQQRLFEDGRRKTDSNMVYIKRFIDTIVNRKARASAEYNKYAKLIDDIGKQMTLNEIFNGYNDSIFNDDFNDNNESDMLMLLDYYVKNELRGIVKKKRKKFGKQIEKFTRRYEDEQLKKLIVFTKTKKTNKFTELKREALKILKNKIAFSSKMGKNLGNFYSMCLYFREFISKEYPQCQEKCDEMLDRLLIIFESTEKGNKRLLDVNSTALVFSDFILESGRLSLEKAGGEKNNVPLYYTDGKGSLLNGTAGVFKSSKQMLCYYSSGDAIIDAFEKFLNVKGYTTDISIKRCISDVLVPEKTICTYRSRYSSEVTVDKIRQKAYKFYMDKLTDFNTKRNKNR